MNEAAYVKRHTERKEEHAFKRRGSGNAKAKRRGVREFIKHAVLAGRG